MKRLLPVLMGFALLLLLSGCQTTAIVSSGGKTFEYPDCDSGTNEDVFGGLKFKTTHPFNEKDYGCALVSKADGFPVFDGTQSARFEVRPGDCSASSGWDDCPNDRSRHEIQEAERQLTEGDLLTYELMVYIPSKPKIKPQGYRNLLVLTQINIRDLPLYTALAYLKFDHGTLQIQTHHEFTWEVKRIYMVVEDPLDQWIKVKFEVNSTSGWDGYLKVFVNDELKVYEIGPTLPTSDAETDLRFGIYNASVSQATEPYGKQVVYFDAISKSVK